LFGPSVHPLAYGSPTCLAPSLSMTADRKRSCGAAVATATIQARTTNLNMLTKLWFWRGLKEVQLGPAVHQSHAGSVPPKIERRDCRGILAPDNENVVIKVRMRLTVVVKHLRQIFTGNIEEVRQVVVSGRDDQFAGVVIVDSSQPIGGSDLEIAVPPIHRLHPLVLCDRQTIVLRNLAVILERFLTCGFLIGSAERDVANLEQLWRSKKSHVGGIVEDGIDHATLINRDDLESGSLRLDRTGKTRRPGSDDKHVDPGVGARLRLSARERVWNL